VSESLRFLRHPAVLLLTLLLVGQAFAYYLLPKSEHAPTAPQMKLFPTSLGSWKMVADYPIEDLSLIHI